LITPWTWALCAAAGLQSSTSAARNRVARNVILNILLRHIRFFSSRSAGTTCLRLNGGNEQAQIPAKLASRKARETEINYSSRLNTAHVKRLPRFKLLVKLIAEPKTFHSRVAPFHTRLRNRSSGEPVQSPPQEATYDWRRISKHVRIQLWSH